MSDQAKETPAPASASPAGATALTAAPAAEVKPDAAQAAKPADAGEPTKAAAEGEAKTDAKPDQAAAKDKPAADAEKVPEEYNLTLPENSLLSKAHVETLASLAKEKGYSSEQAQLLLERESSAAQAGVVAMQEKAQQMSQQWLQEAKVDPEFGGAKFDENVTLAHRALEAFFPDSEIKKFMDLSGLGNHKSILKGFAAIGRQMSSEKIVVPGNQPPPRPPMQDRLYDHPTSKKS